MGFFFCFFLSETRLHLQKRLLGLEDGLLFYNQIIISLFFPAIVSKSLEGRNLKEHIVNNEIKNQVLSAFWL